MRSGKSPSIPKFTEAMYEGNESCGVGHEHIDGGYCQRWSCKWGDGETYNGRLVFGAFSFNPKVKLYICGDVLWITDFRYAGKTDTWEYSSHPEKLRMSNIHPSRLHKLEKEKIEEILTLDISCEWWRLIQKRAKEIWTSDQEKNRG